MIISSNLSNFTPPLVIDFSIQKSNDGTKTQKGIPQVEQKKNPPIPEIKKVTPVHNPLPEMPKAEIIEKAAPPVTKKKIVEKTAPKQVEIVELRKNRAKKKVVAEKSTITERIIPDQAVAAEDFVDDDLDKRLDAQISAPAAGPVITQSPLAQKDQYLKEHFLYIKENVQKKITYPRMAKKMGWQGKARISFVICQDGSVKDIRVIESSGFKALDNNAVKVIKQCAPFPSPPVAAELIIPVTYKLN